MKTILHKANERGHANHGWLDAHHSFSFAGYQDENKIHFGALRVLNDDIVKPGFGFGQHPHDNMEIVTIPLRGALEHKDNTGGQGVIRKNDIQIMSAGSGVYHSEYNHSKTEEVNLLQIWVFPNKRSVTPRYDQKTFDPAERHNRIQTVIAPGNEEGLWLHQDVYFSLANLDKGTAIPYTIQKNGNGVYLFVIEGSVTVDGTVLEKRDAIGMSETDKLNITANSDAEILLIDVPMQIQGVA